ncbi:MAG TPA: site-2 protease family protein [Gemmatimonadales bacterium]
MADTTPIMSVAPFLTAWRTTATRDREIIEAHVAHPHAGPSLALGQALERWPGLHYWAERDGGTGRRLVLIRALGPATRERWWLHALLLITTFVTVLYAGTEIAGAVLPPAPHASPLALRQLWAQVAAWATGLRPGLPFATALLAILVTHEAGHYVAARRYAIDVSPPYFLPAPTWFLIGTLGAFIRVRSPIADRRQLIDVGAAGPWAGVVVAVVALVMGLAHSTPTDLVGPSKQMVMIAGTPYFLGDSILTSLARRLVSGDGALVFSPLAFAGWMGLFVTMLNLLPLGQLDGGHVVYAMLRERQTWVARAMWYLLLVLGIRWKSWWLWAAITLIIGRGRVGHPSVLDRYRALPRSRQVLGWLTLALFVATFMPVPFPSWEVFGS